MSKQNQNLKSENLKQKLPKVSVIIVNYNTKPFLKKCIENLQGKGGYPNLQIVVVDNNSKDGSYEMVKKNFKNITLIKSPNKGLAHGFNLAFANTKADYYLLLGSDAYPNKGCIKDMVTYMQKNPKVGISTAKLILKNGQLDMDAHRGFPTPWTALTHFSKLNKVFPKSKIFNQYFRHYEDFTKPHEIDMCISHFMLIKNEVVRRLKGFDEDYFLYGEDVDFCYRAKKIGYKVMYLADCQSLHYKGVSVGVRKESKNITTASKETKERSRKSSVASMKIFYSKNYKNVYPKFVTSSVLLGINIMSIVRNKLSK
jgi:hypothetical protein